MGTAGSPPYVLLADGDASACKLLNEFFTQEGWQVDIVSNKHEALHASAMNSYDLLIVDDRIPDLFDFHTLSKMRQQKPAQALLLISSKGEMDKAHRIIGTNEVSGVIKKPIDLENFENTVRQLVKKSRQKQEEGFACERILSEDVSFEFTSLELSRTKVPLGIIEHLHKSGKIDLNVKLRIELAFQEALANSLEHGNLELESIWKDEFSIDGIDRFSIIKYERLNDPVYANRKIKLNICYKDSTIKITIKDEGKGFAPKTGNNGPEEITQGHGRGISLIENVLDEVHYTCGGREITMIKSFK